MTTSVLGEVIAPHEVERKPYLCATLPSSPVANLSFKTMIRGLPAIQREQTMEDGTTRVVERFHYKAIGFPARTIRYRGPEDIDGFPVTGKINELSADEIEDLKVEVKRRVVRWRGRENRDGIGVGPGAQYTDGRIIETHTFEGKPHPRYRPHVGDEPLLKYIVMRPVGDEELKSRSMAPRNESAGFNLLGDDAPEENTAPISADELQKQIDALKAQLKATEAKELAQAEKSEAEDLATREGRKLQKNQTRKKGR